MSSPSALAKWARSLKLPAPRAVEGFADQPYWAVDVPGADAVNVWQAFRNAAGETGHWPVILGNYYGPEGGGSDAIIESFVETAEAARESANEPPGLFDVKSSPEEILAAALALPFEAWVAQQRDPRFQVQEHLRKAAFFDQFPGAASIAQGHRETAERWLGQSIEPTDSSECKPPTVNKNPPQRELHCIRYFDATTQKDAIAEALAILCVPTVHGWEAPAYLFYETSERERLPQVHVAALHWLHEQFGAELIGLEDRTLEVSPQRRPRTWAEAVHAADLLSAYSRCPITSENELATTFELAVYLMESTYWSFCWP